MLGSRGIWRKIKSIGKGSFGQVYLVRRNNDTSSKMFVMKEVRLAGLPPKELSAAKAEVAALKKVSHPHIIKYYESFTHGRAVYIVMELVEGATLLDHLNSLAEKGWAMPEERVWRLFSQLCLALRYIHKERHVVHRDLTPSNIMLSAEGVIKLADFGLAKQRHGTQSILESVVGTVLYQCPEIIQHEAYGEKADIWAFGLILLELAAGAYPYPQPDNFFDLLGQITDMPAPRLTEGCFGPAFEEFVGVRASRRCSCRALRGHTV